MTAANGAVVVVERSRAHRRLGGDIVDLCLSQTTNFDLIEAALHVALTDVKFHRAEARKSSTQPQKDGGSRNHEHNQQS